MNLHTVAPGETLSAIGRIYGVDPGLIARVNGLQPPYPLAVGQSLLVLTPSILHTVVQGDTLWSVALQYGVSPLELLRNNPNLQGLARLYPGEVLVVAWDDVPGRAIDLNGYAYPYVDEAVLRGILPYSDYLAPFTFGVSESGGVVDLNDAALLRLAERYGVTPVFHLSTLTEDGSFSNERAAYVLSDPGRQAALADTVVSLAVDRGYGAIDVDFEFIYPEQAEQYAQFVTTLREKANAVGLEVWVALAPKTSADQAGVLYEGHNYKLLGEAADAVLLMTYEWGYTYGPPMAVAPIQSVRRVLDYAVTEIPPEKIFLGFPNYAYNWTLPFSAGESRADSLSNVEAPLLAARVGAEIRFDETGQTPYFNYTDAQGRVHEVWFEDPRSCLAKFRLLDEYGFRGVGVWNYMRPFPACFSLLAALHRIGPDT